MDITNEGTRGAAIQLPSKYEDRTRKAYGHPLAAVRSDTRLSNSRQYSLEMRSKPIVN